MNTYADGSDHHQSRAAGHSIPTLEQQMAVLLELTRAITEAQTLSVMLTGVLSPIAQAAGWCYGEVWLPEPNAEELRSAARWHEPDPALERFAATSAELKFTPGGGLLGRVWQNRQAEWIADLHMVDPAKLMRPERAGPAGLHSGLAIPLLIDNVVIAILVFFAREVRPENPQLRRLMTLVAAQLSTAISRLQAQEALRAQESLLRSVTQSAADAILVLDVDGRIIAWNPAAERMFGYAAAEAIGRSFTLIIPPAYHARYIPLFPWRARQPSLNERGRMIELIFLRNDGSEFPAEVALSDWRAEHGPCLTAIIRDATERKRSELLLRQANEELEQRVIERTAALQAANGELERAARMKDEFLANMSHELRTPLNAILTLSELLGDGVYGALNAEQRDATVGVIESGQHLLALINDILDLTKIESGTEVLELEAVDIAEVCGAGLRMTQHIAQQKHIRVSEWIDPEIGLVLADPRRLKQICVNLLVNAIKFTPRGRCISRCRAIASSTRSRLRLPIPASGSPLKIFRACLSRLYNSTAA
ncbi:MAG: PAS domain S-box protein [Oscillochloris sp.]|nr:PAS domain S-box protein [Oscillochloris sp.]